ncbi:MAG TPA: recombination mediator RecR [Rickettsiales bacterium]|nr:recombination mediator RecR [Rickettsiales bacterium]
MNNILNDLIKVFSKLPSLGPRSARRMVLHLLNNKESVMSPLISLLEEGYQNIKKCPKCGNLTTDDTCEICIDTTRNNDVLCIVESVADLWAIESTMIYKGQYHVLGGSLSASEGRGPNDLNLEGLVNRLNSDSSIKEVIIATNPTIEGQTTAFYIVDLLKGFDVKIMKPAYGIPLGSEFNYLDESTLDIAFKNKKEF